MFLSFPRLVDWTQREAYIILAEREEAGLPLIDPNLIPPEKVGCYFCLSVCLSVRPFIHTLY